MRCGRCTTICWLAFAGWSRCEHGPRVADRVHPSEGGVVTVGGLFSGIGGIERGLEAAGMRVLWHAESDEFCRRLLARHWPGVPCYTDVRDTVHAERVDVLAGGFPCQHVSQAAARTTRADGWLWPLFAEVIAAQRPRWVIIENTEGLRYANRGLSDVLSDLAGLGFDAEWRVVRASDFGAPHKRARVWVVAYSNAHGESALPVDDEAPLLSEPFQAVPDWRALPDLRVADGVPDRVLRRERLGNAVVPAVAEWVGSCVMRAA